MAFKNGYRLWDDEFKRQYWTPEQIARSKNIATKIRAIAEAEHNGEISHDEAMIRHLMLDPDLADIMLDDAINDGDMNEVRNVHRRIEEAKARIRENPPSSSYWQEVTDNAQETARTGYNIKEAITQVSKALSILQAAVPA